tara:strand:+ start:5637 stop:6143 length:507 start_codon:yes stop_codon:yes gene_type:complete
MMKQISIYLGIFLVLAISRFIPHPPNFTSLLALSFYVPALLGLKYLPVLLISFAITDLFIGYHTGTHWTWGSVLVIGLISQYFCKNINFRLIGASTGAFIFFAITNFGVWISSDMYANSFEGLLTAYVMAIPFFYNTLLSTIIYSVLIEFLYKVTKNKFSVSKWKVKF